MSRKRASERTGERGVSLVELVSVTAILLVLASVALPVANTMVKRQKELELRRALRTVREALDRFQADVQRYQSMRLANLKQAANEEGYPEELEQLLAADMGDAAGTKLKYLRRIPIDPLTGEADWRTRSSRDRPDSLFSDGINIFDVRSKSDKVALDGTKYATW